MNNIIPDSLYGISKETWFSFEALRRSGIINMWGAKETLGLTRDEFTAIVKNYSEMNEAWKEEFDKTGIEIGIHITRNEKC